MELKLDNITKNYGTAATLSEVSFTLNPGVYGLLGANGAGKTTLFRIICGLMKPTQGAVKYNNRDISTQAESFRTILGFLPQDFSYYPDFTVLKFMLYISSLKGLNHKTAKKRCLKLLKQVGLDDVKGKRIRKYSGGMKQRLGIAQAMINDPEILILDEPTAGLDPKERVKFRKLISSFASKKIVILSTHIVADVEYIADEILILKEGRLVDRGSVPALLKEIQHQVWECLISEGEVTEMEEKFLVSNRRHVENDILLRIVSDKKPKEDARQVDPALEDLYLFYFQEGDNIE
mgnify:CR=1 FL=1